MPFLEPLTMHHRTIITKPKWLSVFLIIGGALCLLALYHRTPLIISNENRSRNDDEIVTEKIQTLRTLSEARSQKYDENLPSSLISEAASGQEFNGLPFRNFPQHLRKFHNETIIKSKKMPDSKWNCTKWGVVTTIFAPPKQEAVRRFLYRKDWCVVVVGDKNRPKVSTFCILIHFGLIYSLWV